MFGCRKITQLDEFFGEIGKITVLGEKNLRDIGEGGSCFISYFPTILKPNQPLNEMCYDLRNGGQVKILPPFPTFQPLYMEQQQQQCTQQQQGPGKIGFPKGPLPSLSFSPILPKGTILLPPPQQSPPAPLPLNLPPSPAVSTTPRPLDDSLLSVLAAVAIEKKSERKKTVDCHELVVRLVSSPPSNELVARKTVKFSVMMTGDDANLPGNLHLAAVLVDAKTLSPISCGLMEKKVKLKRDPASRPPQDAILQRIVPYRETGMEFQIVKGSAKKKIQNQVKFELRLYKGPVESKKYEVVDSVFSPVYRLLTHSSQLGRSSA